MTPVYCSNFYTFVQCRNFTTAFGNRCGPCNNHGRGKAMKEDGLSRRGSVFSDMDSDEEPDHTHESNVAWTNIEMRDDQSPSQRVAREGRAGDA